ncbi:MAG: HAMP domain-containing sensor histidine kinase [Elusimicrobiota bacterium]
MTAVSWLLAGLVLGWIAHSLLSRRIELKRARMLSFIAHEINGPITALNMTVLNFIEGTFGKLDEAQEPWFRMIRGEVSRLTAIVGDLRDLIHLEFHRDFKIYFEPVDVNDILKELSAELDDSFQRMKIPFEIKIKSKLPELSGDATRIRRALMAALSHARKFRTAGGVRLNAEPGPENVVFCVEYRGLQAGPDRVNCSLGLYHPVEGKNREVLAGVGAGLGLARVLITAHGGRMSMTSEPNGDTRITISLPRPQEQRS